MTRAKARAQTGPIPEWADAPAEVASGAQIVLPRIWVQDHNLRTETAAPLRFEDQPALRQSWDDPHPRKRYMKSAQAGVTTMALYDALHTTGVQGLTAIYTLPTDGDVSSLVNGRLDKMIDASPLLREWTGRDRPEGARRKLADNTGLKQVAGGTLYLRGTRTANKAVSTPAQALYHDEVDLSIAEILELYDHRLDAVDPPARRKKWEFSTPTTPGHGIARLFGESTGCEWMVRCARCGWIGPLKYEQHTRGYLDHLACSECSAELDPRQGEWVAARPDEDVHGYHVTTLLRCLPGRPDLVLKLHEKRLKAKHIYQFINNDLGEPTKEGTIQADEEQLKDVLYQDSYPVLIGGAGFDPGPFYLAGDQGDTLSVGIARGNPFLDGAGLRVVYLVRLRDPSRGSQAWERLAELMTEYNITFAVIDAQPNSANAHDFVQLFPGRAVACYYREAQSVEVVESADVSRIMAAGGRTPVQLTDRMEIHVDRTESLDRTMSLIQTGGFSLPGVPPEAMPENQELIRHVVNNLRRPEEDARGGIVYRWHKEGINDYFHVLNYLRLAREVAADQQARRPRRVAPVIIQGLALPPAHGRLPRARLPRHTRH